MCQPLNLWDVADRRQLVNDWKSGKKKKKKKKKKKQRNRGEYLCAGELDTKRDWRENGARGEEWSPSVTQKCLGCELAGYIVTRVDVHLWHIFSQCAMV